MLRLTPSKSTWLGCLCAMALVLAIAAEARAGDRGLYLAFADARGLDTEDPRRDALERALFRCGEETLAACRASRVPDSDHDTERTPLYAMPSSALDLELVERARTSAAGRIALSDAVNGLGMALDGVVLVRPEGERLVLVLINLNTRRVLQLPVRPDGTLADGPRARAQRFLEAGWVP